MSSITNSPLFIAGAIGMAGSALIEGGRALLESSLTEILPSQKMNGIALIASTALLVFGIAHSLLRKTAPKDVITLSKELETDAITEKRWPNVVLLGMTRTGKTTFKRTLENPTYTPPQPKMFSATRQAEADTISMGATGPQVRIMDTPGLCDIVEDKGRQLKDTEIIADNEKAIISEFGGYDKVDHVFMTLKLDERLCEQEIDAIRRYAEYLKSKGITNLTLLLTHCEKFSDEQNKDLIAQGRNHGTFDDLIKEFFKNGEAILYSGGLPSHSHSMWAGDVEQTVSMTLNRVMELRKRIGEKIWGQVEWDSSKTRSFDVDAKLKEIEEHHFLYPELEELESTIPPKGFLENLPNYAYMPEGDKEFYIKEYEANKLRENSEKDARNKKKLWEYHWDLKEFRTKQRPLFEAWAAGNIK